MSQILFARVRKLLIPWPVYLVIIALYCCFDTCFCSFYMYSMACMNITWWWLYASTCMFQVYNNILLGDFDFWKPIPVHISNLKAIFLIYLLSIYFARSFTLVTYGIIFTFMVLKWYKINKITYYLNPIIPFQTDIGRFCSRYRYSDISIFIFGAFQNRYCNFFCKIDTIFWFIAQHYYNTVLAMYASKSYHIWNLWVIYTTPNYPTNNLLSAVMVVGCDEHNTNFTIKP